MFTHKLKFQILWNLQEIYCCVHPSLKRSPFHHQIRPEERSILYNSLSNSSRSHFYVPFLVAPSKRSDLSGHCGVCMDVCMYVCSLVRQFLVRQFDPPPQMSSDLKIPNETMFHAFLSNFDFLTPPPPPPPPPHKGNFRKHQIWLDVCSDRKKMFSNFF